MKFDPDDGSFLLDYRCATCEHNYSTLITSAQTYYTAGTVKCPFDHIIIRLSTGCTLEVT
jgi:hypothetical protein